MDCTFDCPGPSRKRAVARKYGRLHGRARNSSNKVSTTSIVHGVPSKAVEHIYAIRALEDHGPAWQKYAPKGIRYYADWRAKTGPDVEYRCDFDEYFEVAPILKKTPTKRIQVSLLLDGFGFGPSYYVIVAKGPRENPVADFSNTISAQEGDFLANGNDRGARTPNRFPLTVCSQLSGSSPQWRSGCGKKRS